MAPVAVGKCLAASGVPSLGRLELGRLGTVAAALETLDVIGRVPGALVAHCLVSGRAPPRNYVPPPSAGTTAAGGPQKATNASHMPLDPAVAVCFHYMK